MPWKQRDKGCHYSTPLLQQVDEAVYLIGDGDVSVLAEGVSFGEAGGRVFDQVESAQLPERHEQFFDLNFERDNLRAVPRVDLQKIAI